MENGSVSTIGNVLDDIRDRIFLHEFDDEQAVTESELADMYGVSRGSIRSAIQTLESEGLIIVGSTGRKNIRRIDQKFTDDLYLTRTMIETQALRICLDKDDIDRTILAGACLKFYNLYEYSGDELYEMRSVVNTAFHRAIVETADNVVLLKCWTTIEPLINCIAKFNYIHLGDKQTNEELIETHQRLMDMTFRRDEKVLDLITEHIGTAESETNWGLLK